MSQFSLVDSHCHLDKIDLAPFKNNLQSVLQSARSACVKHFLTVCIHPNEFKGLLHIAEQNKDISVSIGLHPTEEVENEPSVTQLAQWAKHPKVVAIGETGLDYYHENYNKFLQQQRFQNHIRAAKQVQKPLIVHTRNAVEDTLSLLETEGAAEVGGVLHCFTENLKMAEYVIEKLNFYISFSGILTFKNSISLQMVARQLPLHRLLIETDSPYLAPVPYRGKSNQPAYVSYVAHTLAHLKNLTVEKVAEQTTKNFFDLFQSAHQII